MGSAMKTSILFGATLEPRLGLGHELARVGVFCQLLNIISSIE